MYATYVCVCGVEDDPFHGRHPGAGYSAERPQDSPEVQVSDLLSVSTSIFSHRLRAQFYKAVSTADSSSADGPEQVLAGRECAGLPAGALGEGGACPRLPGSGGEGAVKSERKPFISVRT